MPITKFHAIIGDTHHQCSRGDSLDDVGAVSGQPVRARDEGATHAARQSQASAPVTENQEAGLFKAHHDAVSQDQAEASIEFLDVTGIKLGVVVERACAEGLW